MPSQLSIFVCYRRTDGGSESGRIYDHLTMRFGKDHLFKDVDSIPFGVDFRRHLEDEITKCDIVIAVIGPTWLTAVDECGNRRLDDPADWVRLEIETALKRDIPVVPLLVRGATMPREHDLPPSLRDLAYRNSALARPDPDFRNDMARLMNNLQGISYSPKPVYPRAKAQYEYKLEQLYRVSLSVFCSILFARLFTIPIIRLFTSQVFPESYWFIFVLTALLFVYPFYRLWPWMIARIRSLFGG